MSDTSHIHARLNHYHTISPLQKRSTLSRLDTYPFFVCYFILAGTPWLMDTLDMKSGNEFWNYLFHFGFPLLLVSHVALVLACQWSIAIQARVGFWECPSSSSVLSLSLENHASWTHCLVSPPNSVSFDNVSSSSNKTNGKANGTGSSVGRMEIIPIEREMGLKGEQVLKINYEEMVFRCCVNEQEGGGTIGADAEMDRLWEQQKHAKEDNVKMSPPRANIMDRQASMPSKSTISTPTSQSLFHRLHFPIDLRISFYQSWSGHTTQSLTTTTNIYSNNDLTITLPPFMELLKHQLVAPFFLFQLVCVALWCLDEYWYYAIFTLFTLVMFESTLAFTRLKNLQRLRDTLRPPFPLWVYRNELWEVIETIELVTGDVVSLTSQHSSLGGGLPPGNGQTSSQHDHEGGTHIPADLLLLKGDAVVNEAMLTGESVPQMKESIDLVASAMESSDDGNAALDLDDTNYKRAILFGGTLLVNHHHEKDDEESRNNEESGASTKIPTPPDGGCTALVLRTGFETQQGSLLRTMIHTSTKSQNDGVNTADTFIFIFLLLLCALLSSAFVLYHGWYDSSRNRFKLILHVIIIITSVVPPELPMELSLAVTSSLSDLMKRCNVYCTEPFRIPLAGMVDVCAFDKTGTLTSDEMVLRGVRSVIQENNEDKSLAMPKELILPEWQKEDNESSILPLEVLRVMVGCQSLSTLGSGNGNAVGSTEIIGDPLEKAVLRGCGWTLLSNNMVAPPQYVLSQPTGKGKSNIIGIHHRFAFTSKLKRMTVLASDMSTKELWALTKGAPETLREFLDPSSIPTSYDAVSKYHMSLGQRVLAMGYKQLDTKTSLSEWKKLGRKVVEHDLVFAGFLVLDCPLKPDSKRTIKELKQSGHKTVMITGDAILTAAEVARQVGIIDLKGATKNLTIYELREIADIQFSTTNRVKDSSDGFAFVPLTTPSNTKAHSESHIAYSPMSLKVVEEMMKKHDRVGAVCVTGDVLTKLAIEAVRMKTIKRGHHEGKDKHTIPYINPKTILLHPDAQSTLQALVPLVSVFARHAPRQKEAVIAAFNGAGRVTLMCGDGTNDVGALKMSHVGISIISVPDLEAKQRDALGGLEQIQQENRKDRDKNRKYKNGKKSKKKKQKQTFEGHLKALAEAEEEISNVALGDASVASPFTSRATSIKCTKDVLQRGRCTLVTMLQIYKILGELTIVELYSFQQIQQSDSWIFCSIFRSELFGECFSSFESAFSWC